MSRSAPPVCRIVLDVDLTAHHECHAGGKIGLDEPRQHVDGGPLGGNDQVDAYRSGHLRQAAQVALHLGRGRHHQVRQLIDDDDDEGEPLPFRRVGIIVVRPQISISRVGEHLVAAAHLARCPGQDRHHLSSGFTTTGINRCGMSL